MQVTLKCTNLPEFRAVMREYMKMLPRELAHALNWKSLVIVKDTQKHTPLAERSKIEHDMGVAGYQVKTVKQGKNKGKLRKTNLPIWFPHPRALQIVLGRMRKAGHTAINFQTAMEKARRMVMARIRGIGSLKAGWSKPLRMLAAGVKGQAFDPSQGRKRVKLEGYSKPAGQRQWKSSVEVSFDVMDKSRHVTGWSGVAYPKVVEALNAAIGREAQKTLDYIRRRLGRESAKFIKSTGYNLP